MQKNMSIFLCVQGTTLVRDQTYNGSSPSIVAGLYYTCFAHVLVSSCEHRASCAAFSIEVVTGGT